jgi:hypothetical protein
MKRIATLIVLTTLLVGGTVFALRLISIPKTTPGRSGLGEFHGPLMALPVPVLALIGSGILHSGSITAEP